MRAAIAESDTLRGLLIPRGSCLRGGSPMQVRLWEAETLRVRYSACVLYEQFETPQLFQNSCEFARNQGHLLWSSHVQGMFAARETGHEQVRTYIKALKEALVQEAEMAAAAQ
eukprot:90399-Chlamydomonas_euryale.AAC.4